MSKKEKFWSQPLRVETPEHVQLATTRCIRAELWFVNNPDLEERITAFLAKYVEKYQVDLYNFDLTGSHYHLEAQFPKGNMAHFFRDFNARVAESVRLLVENFESGPLFERRYCNQVLPENPDIEDYFFYCALQPVHSGLCAKISEYPSHSFFNEAVSGTERTYKFFSYGEYHKAKQQNIKVNKDEFWQYHTLKFKRLPGYEDLSQAEYSKLMHDKLEQRRVEAINELIKEKEVRFLTKADLRKVRPGARPKNSKKGTRRPLVLSRSQLAKKVYLEWYFDIVEKYKEACAKYRAGDFTVLFPPGTYKPAGIAIY